MSQRRHLTDSEAWRIVGRLEGVPNTSRSSRSYWSYTKCDLETGSAGRRPGQGRRPTPSLGYWHHNFDSNCPKPAPRCRTVCSPTSVILRVRHRRVRREWATEHMNWRRNEWCNVLFSDDSRFSVHPDDRRIFIWKERDA
ncbi:transposable element Tcb2 transposase [Nephila pilipes]|uniref:Transposable element Tcb2 transposase n=1 Tax=Nephila pilipes TaxID=299642 RepID=A0A8X6NZ81_NEPPI|nr:transposable element Tcb2 transposase [Nephila pilipes]